LSAPDEASLLANRIYYLKIYWYNKLIVTESYPSNSTEVIEAEAQQRVAVLVAWPYGNGPRHLGHGASLVPGDIIARYHRSIGNDVMMVSGTDEFGTPNMIAAEKAGVDTAEYVAMTNEVIRNDFIDLGMSFDWFTRTTSKEHEENAQGFFTALVEAEYIEKGTMLGAFDSDTGQALPDRYIEGGCPHCGACSRGDQCEECSSLLDPTDLLNPVSKITGNSVDFAETEHYFLQLDKLAPDVIDWLENNQQLRPNAKASSMQMAKELRPRAITRDMNWGVPLPAGYELDAEADKVLYVWFEAVIGYVSASIEWAKYAKGNPDLWKEWWQEAGTSHYYAMGKDNVPFHTIIWPAMIAAANKSDYSDVQLKQPEVIASTEYLTFNEGKFSSSRGNVVYISDLIQLIGTDALRYYLISAGPETKDTTFTFGELTKRVNDELIAKWGNLVSRSFTLINKNHEGKVPAVSIGELDANAQELLGQISAGYGEVGNLVERAKFSAALKTVFGLTAQVNKFIFDAEPWKTVKHDFRQAEKDMYVVMTAVSNINNLLTPFIPHASQRIHQLFGNTTPLASQPYSRVLENGMTVLTGDYSQDKNHWKFSLLRQGQTLHDLGKQHLFAKIDQEKLEEGFEEIVKLRSLGQLALRNRN
jgi:methionyl-tRNA synthetase